MGSFSKMWRDRTPLKTATWLSNAGILVGLGILIFGIHTLIESRADAWNRAQQDTANLAQALEQDINHSLSNYNQALIGTQDAFRMPGLGDLTPDLRQAVVFSRATAQADFGSIIILDRDGRSVLASNPNVPPRSELADRDYFAVHRDGSHSGLYISRPFKIRFSNGEPSIALSRRLASANGEFDGVVAGIVRLSFFQHLFEKLNLGPNGSLKIIRTDGPLITRVPQGDTAMDTDTSGSSLLRRSASVPSGQYILPPSIDRLERLITYRVIDGLPLVLAIGLATQDIYSGWWHQAIVIGCLIITLCAVNITLSLLFKHEMRLRLRAESLLTDSSDKLTVLALTDGLTQIGNRRAFDTELDRVWRAAIRAEQPVALLMFDVDHFKAYNDTQGHQAGDKVLSQIAACVRQRLRRPTDFAARYGGEEFAALLPNTDADGALEIAETIRSVIAQAGIAHPNSPNGCVTVSVGVGVAYPRHGQAEADLIHEADAALYRAKQNGRNRTCFDNTTLTSASGRLERVHGTYTAPSTHRTIQTLEAPKPRKSISVLL